MANRILIVDDDPITLRIVGNALQKAGFEVFTAENGRIAFNQIKGKKPDLVILDIVLPDINGYEICSKLRQNPETAHLPVIMLTGLDTVEEKIKGFQVGADAYLPKPVSSEELVQRIKALLRRGTPALPSGETRQPGKIICVFSLRGGLGSTTIASNLAAGLTQLWDSPAVLVDLAPIAGQCDLMFNLPARHSWDDLSHYPPEEIDEEMVEQVLLTHSGKTRILACSSDLEKSEKLSPEAIKKILSILSRKHEHVIIDLPHDFHPNTIAALDQAELIVGMMAPELASVRAMTVALGAFKKLGFDSKKTILAINWIFQKHGLAKKDIESILNSPIDLVIPFVPDSMLNAINKGAPVVIFEPETPLGSFLEDFAFSVSRDSLKKRKPSNPTESWKRVYARLKKRQTKK
jgi:pilus assembly protein CpaE